MSKTWLIAHIKDLKCAVGLPDQWKELATN